MADYAIVNLEDAVQGKAPGMEARVGRMHVDSRGRRRLEPIAVGGPKPGEADR